MSWNQGNWTRKLLYWLHLTLLNYCHPIWIVSSVYNFLEKKNTQIQFTFTISWVRSNSIVDTFSKSLFSSSIVLSTGILLKLKRVLDISMIYVDSWLLRQKRIRKSKKVTTLLYLEPGAWSLSLKCSSCLFSIFFKHQSM